MGDAPRDVDVLGEDEVPANTEGAVVVAAAEKDRPVGPVLEIPPAGDHGLDRHRRRGGLRAEGDDAQLPEAGGTNHEAVPAVAVRMEQCLDTGLTDESGEG